MTVTKRTPQVKWFARTEPGSDGWRTYPAARIENTVKFGEDGQRYVFEIEVRYDGWQQCYRYLVQEIWHNELRRYGQDFQTQDEAKEAAKKAFKELWQEFWQLSENK